MGLKNFPGRGGEGVNGTGLVVETYYAVFHQGNGFLVFGAGDPEKKMESTAGEEKVPAENFYKGVSSPPALSY